MPKGKGYGIMDRAKRKVAFDTAKDEPGYRTKFKRGLKMIGALATEAFAPGGNVPSKTAIQDKAKVGAQERAQAAAAKKKARQEKAAKRREGFETKVPVAPRVREVEKGMIGALGSLAKSSKKKRK